MSGLLGGVLPTIFSQADRAKRYLGGLLSDPIGRLEQAGGQAKDDLTKIGLLSEQAFNDPKNPMKLQDNAAARQLVDTYLSSVLNFAPAGMFVGPKSATWDKAAAQKAQALAQKGVDPRQVWKETGTFKGPDGAWRQEIDDSASYIKGKDGTVLDALRYGNTPDKVMFHPKLEKAYQMDSVRIGSPEGMTSRGSMSLVEVKPSLDDLLNADDLMAVQPKRISEINVSRTSPDQRSTLLHELQHDIQQREGFATGGSMTEANVLDMLPEAKAMHEKLMLSRDPNEIGLLSKQLRALRNDPEKQLEAYRRLAGEAEARATQARMNMNMQQRRDLFPLDSYDVPLDQLILRR